MFKPSVLVCWKSFEINMYLIGGGGKPQKIVNLMGFQGDPAPLTNVNFLSNIFVSEKKWMTNHY